MIQRRLRKCCGQMKPELATTQPLCLQRWKHYALGCFSDRVQDDFASLSGPMERPTHCNISDSFPRPGHWQLVMDEFPAWKWLMSCRKDQVKYLFPSLTCKFFYTFYVMCVFFWIFCLIKTYKFRDQIIVSPLHSWLMDISNCRC